MSVSLSDKKKALQEIIGREKRAAVACSGGVDSTFLLKTVQDVLGHENTIAVFAETGLLPPGEVGEIRRITGDLNCRLLTVSLDPLMWPEFTANPPDRCYLCKKKIYQTFWEKLADFTIPVLMDGTNLDDLSDYRPGLEALAELGIKTPLADAGLTKKNIRQLSRDMGLHTWNKHSSSCLATRIGVNQDISREKIDLIRRCEDICGSYGFMGCRVRLADNAVTIELIDEDIERFIKDDIRKNIAIQFKDFGIEKIFVDLAGRKGIEL